MTKAFARLARSAPKQRESVTHGATDRSRTSVAKKHWKFAAPMTILRGRRQAPVVGLPRLSEAGISSVRGLAILGDEFRIKEPALSVGPNDAVGGASHNGGGFACKSGNRAQFDLGARQGRILTADLRAKCKRRHRRSEPQYRPETLHRRRLISTAKTYHVARATSTAPSAATSKATFARRSRYVRRWSAFSLDSGIVATDPSLSSDRICSSTGDAT